MLRAAALLASLAQAAAQPSRPRNVLLIIVDDLRPEVAYMGERQMITPNIDALAKTSLVFNRAFCQQAICGPTRNSFLSGRRPQRTKTWNFIDNFREEGVGADWVAFPEYFKNAGYTTLGTGKTFHPGSPPNFDMPKSWTNSCNGPEGACKTSATPNPANASDGVDGSREYVFSTNAYPKCGRGDSLPGSLVCPNAAPIESFSDTIDMRASISDLRYAAQKTDNGVAVPFFLATGFHRPHLPWNIPQRFWDMYPPTEDIALPKHQAGPTDMPPIAFTYELDGKINLTAFSTEVPIPYPSAHVGAGYPQAPDNVTRSLRKGYYAAVSFTDHLIGELLAELEALGQHKNTIVALIGDHGWQLGEHNIWGKHTNFELGTRVPIIIRDPAHALKGGLVTNLLTESVDLYPTVAALAGLPPPPDVDGADLSSLFANPNPSPSMAPKPNVAFSEYPRCAPPDAPWTPEHTCGAGLSGTGNKTCSSPQSCVNTPRSRFLVMGYSVRADDYRYTVWLWWDGVRLVGDFTRPAVGVELYAHAGDSEADFDLYENVNVAAANPAVCATMHALAVKQWEKK